MQRTQNTTTDGKHMYLLLRANGKGFAEDVLVPFPLWPHPLRQLTSRKLHVGDTIARTPCLDLGRTALGFNYWQHPAFCQIIGTACRAKDALAQITVAFVAFRNVIVLMLLIVFLRPQKKYVLPTIHLQRIMVEPGGRR